MSFLEILFHAILLYNKKGSFEAKANILVSVLLYFIFSLFLTIFLNFNLAEILVSKDVLHKKGKQDVEW